MRRLIFLFLLPASVFANECSEPDLSFQGKTKSGAPCSIDITSTTGHVYFKTNKQTCSFTIEDSKIPKFIKDHEQKKNTTLKGQYTYIDCKARIEFDKEGLVKKVVLGNKLFLSPKYKVETCLIEAR